MWNFNFSTAICLFGYTSSPFLVLYGPSLTYPTVGSTFLSHTNIDWLQPSVSSLLSPASHPFFVAQLGAEFFPRIVGNPIDPYVE